MEDDQKYLPMMAGFSRKDFFTNENIRLWEYFHALPEKVQDILKSREIARRRRNCPAVCVDIFSAKCRRMRLCSILRKCVGFRRRRDCVCCGKW